MTFKQLLSEHDAFLQIDSSKNPNQYYQTRFQASYDYIYLQTSKEKILATSKLEYSRAQKEASVDKVINTSDYKDREDSKPVLEKILEELNLEKIAVPRDFPVYLADRLREKDFQIMPVENPTVEERKTKTSEEIQKLKTTQETVEKAMQKAKNIIQTSEIRENKLYYQKQVLTSERLKAKIHRFLQEQNCQISEDMIVACGKDSAQPHNKGTGTLKPNKPIIVDIFPKKDMYYGDMTRTFVKGQPSKELQEIHSAVEKALNEALKTISAGVDGEKVYKKMCEVFQETGFETTNNSGFLHSAGHGVGLELHEKPSLSPNSEKLKPGMVITVEPGLYNPDVGGVRIEEMILITEQGYENFNSMSYNLEI